MVGKDNPGWVTPEDVAKVMLDLVEKEENVSGTILEVGEVTRKVEAFNDGGPQSAGNAVKNDPGYEKDMWASMLKMMGEEMNGHAN